MNIIEAIKSGKKFKRPCFPWQNWLYIPALSKIIHRVDGAHYHCDIDDILADDWEIEEEKITITRSQLEEAWNKLFNTPLPTQDNPNNTIQSLYREAFPLLADRLGFK